MTSQISLDNYNSSKTDSSKLKKEISSGLPKSATKRATHATKNAIITVQAHKDLDLLDIKILIVLMNEKKDFTQKEISERCEASPSTISRHLIKLRKNRYITKVQRGKPCIHKLTKKGFNVGCTFLRGYEGDFKDRLHNVKAHCTFQIKRKGKGKIVWETYPMMNWNKYFQWIENVFIWYSDKGNVIHYQLPHIFADTADEATEKAFELIRRVNEQLKKEGFVFTSRPEIEHEGIIITDSHHAAFLDPIAIWLKKQKISVRYKDLVEFDSSFKEVPEKDFIKFPYNHEHFERYMENVAIPAMMGEIKKEDIVGASEDRKISMSLLMEQREKIQEMYENFGDVVTGQTVIITQLPQFIQAVTNLSHAVTEAFLKKDKEQGKEERFDVQEVGKDDKTFLLIKNTIQHLNKPTFVSIYRVLKKKDYNFVEIANLLNYYVSKGYLIYKNGVYRIKDA